MLEDVRDNFVSYIHDYVNSFVVITKDLRAFSDGGTIILILGGIHPRLRRKTGRYDLLVSQINPQNRPFIPLKKGKGFRRSAGEDDRILERGDLFRSLRGVDVVYINLEIFRFENSLSKR